MPGSWDIRAGEDVSPKCWKGPIRAVPLGGDQLGLPKLA